MKESKVVSSLREAIRLSGLQDGMCVSFHHHLRNGDYVVNMVMEQISAMGIRDLTVNASALFDVHLPMLEHIKNGTVSRLLTNYMSAGLGRAISGGVMDQPVEFRTHGGRPRDIAGGETPIDVAFIAAPSSDTMGNCTGKVGKSACGSLGYAFPDAQYAKKVIVITDELVPYPLCGWSIPEIYVDYVVAVDAIGDPAGIVSGTTRMTRNPVAITIAQTAARVIASSGLLKDGFSFQTGAGGASLANASIRRAKSASSRRYWRAIWITSSMSPLRRWTRARRFWTSTSAIRAWMKSPCSRAWSGNCRKRWMCRSSWIPPTPPRWKPPCASTTAKRRSTPSTAKRKRCKRCCRW